MKTLATTGKSSCRRPVILVVVDHLTLNTLPSILNRDMQGRLRRKLVVLKMEKWIARHLRSYTGTPVGQLAHDFYAVDMSSKNPRWVAPKR